MRNCPSNKLWKVEMKDAAQRYVVVYLKLPKSDNIVQLFKVLGCRVVVVEEMSETEVYKRG